MDGYGRHSTHIDVLRFVRSPGSSRLQQLSKSEELGFNVDGFTTKQGMHDSNTFSHDALLSYTPASQLARASQLVRP